MTLRISDECNNELSKFLAAMAICSRNLFMYSHVWHCEQIFEAESMAQQPGAEISLSSSFSPTPDAEAALSSRDCDKRNWRTQKANDIPFLIKGWSYPSGVAIASF
jgi:hypothetical protein